MIKQKGFVRRLLKRLQERFPQFQTLTEDDLDQIVTEFWGEIADCLRLGKRVVFEGWMSFFTKPVKRKCYNMHKRSDWMTFKKRIRTNPLDNFREKAEVELTEEEYILLTTEDKK